jgi:hypothetical protein
VRELYPRLGFTQIGHNAASVLYELPLDDVPTGSGPEFIQLWERNSAVAAAAG